MIDTVISSVYAALGKIGYHHPLHPTQVHIPVGLVIGAFILGIVALIRRQSHLNRCAWYCLLVALIFFFPTLITGLMDWRHRFAGAMLFPFKMKFALAGVLLVLLLTGFFLGRRSKGEAKSMLAIYALCFMVVSGLGYFGGELVYGLKTTSVVKEYQGGQKIYAANCGSCHPNGGNTINAKLPVKNSAKISGFDTFLDWVRNPNPPMPAFPPAAISDQEVRDIFNYITNVLNNG